MLQNFVEVCVCAFKKQLLVNKTMLLLFSISSFFLFVSRMDLLSTQN